MACQVPPLNTLKNTQTFLSTQQLLTYSLSELAVELGFALIADGGVFVPVAPFIWLALSLPDIIQAFSGRPKDQDTNSVIWAYHMSAYWPLQSLGDDLAIALKNGAPISDSRPAIQAQFSAWKLGTIESIQQLAGWPPGPGSPGFWQLQQLINTSWVYSKGGNQAVLQIVKAIDCFTEVLAQMPKPQPPPPPPPPGGGGGGGGGGAGQCDSGNPDNDEILDLCQALQSAIANISVSGGGGGVSDQCCTNVVNAIRHCARQLTVIATALSNPPTPPPPPDLTPIVTALGELVAAVGAIAPGPPVDLTPLVDAVNQVATAISSAPGTDVSGVVDQLKQANAMMDVPQAIIDAVARIGLVNPADAQLAGGGPWAYINTLLHDEWAKLNHKPTPEEVAAAMADPVFGPTVSAKLSGVPIPPFKEVLKMTPSVLGEIAGLGIEKVMELAYPVGKTLYGPMINDMLKVHEGLVSQFVNVQPGGEITNATNLLTEALTFGVGAHWAALLGEKIVPGKHMGVTAIAALLAELAGFKEISQGLIDSEVEAAVGRPHKYFMNLTTRSQLPSSGQAAELYSRRKISPAQLTALMGYAGFSDQWGAALTSIAYRPLSPMMLAAGFANADVDMAALQGALEYMGIRPEDLPLAEQAVITRSLQQTRQALVNEAITAYGQGVVSDAELQQILTDAGYGKAASALVMQRALIARRITLARTSESFIVPEVTAGLLTPAEGAQALEAAGVQPWQADLKMTLAQTKAALVAARKAAAEAQRLVIRRQREETRVAITEYEAGTLDEAALSAALIAIGLDPVLVASTVAVEQAKRAGRLKFVFGQLLAPPAAKVLTEQVAALEGQFKKQLIDEASLRAQLAALKVDAPEIAALVARWAAARTAATKTGYELPIS